MRRVLLAVLVVLAACGGAPSEGQIAEAMKAGAGPLTPWIEVRNLKKTNGRAASDTEYQAWVEYDLVFTKSSKEIVAEMEAPSSRPRPADLSAAVDRGFEVVTTKFALSMFGPFDAGHVVHREDTVTLLRTEKGWVLDTAKK